MIDAEDHDTLIRLAPILSAQMTTKTMHTCFDTKMGQTFLINSTMCFIIYASELIAVNRSRFCPGKSPKHEVCTNLNIMRRSIMREA